MKIAWLTKYKGPESTNIGMIDGLLELGHTVDVVNSQDFAKYGYSEPAIKKFQGLCEKADACVVTKGTWIPKARFTKLAKDFDLTMFTPDSISVGPPGRDIELGRRSLECQRVVLTGTEGARWLRSEGYTRRVAQIYQGHRPEVWEGNRGNREWAAHHCSFLGSFYKGDGNRVDKVRALKRAGIVLYHNKRTFMKRASKLYYNTPVNLNFNCGDITSNRVLRILASGGFCLTQSNADIRHSFENGVHLAWWDEPEGKAINDKEMISLIKHWVKDQKGRIRISEAGYELAKEFTWVNQMGKIVQFLRGVDVPADGAAQEYLGGVDGYQDSVY